MYLKRRASVLMYTACVLIGVAGGGLVYAAIAENTIVSIGGEQDLTGPDSVCWKVTNASATGKAVYVPGSSVAEWQSFVQNPPAGVALSTCATTITIATDQTNANLCTLAGNPTVPGNYVFVINSGVRISSNSTSVAGLTTGTCWPTGSTVTIVNNGYIHGMGGKGGNGGSSLGANGGAGQRGGDAISLGYPVTIDNTNGYILGGGGGGGGGSTHHMYRAVYEAGDGGGGGASGLTNSKGGAGGTSSSAIGSKQGAYGAQGTISGGGAGGNRLVNGGDGGDFGMKGKAGSSGNQASGGGGGAAGRAILLNGFTVTWLGGNDTIRVKGLVQ